MILNDTLKESPTKAQCCEHLIDALYSVVTDSIQAFQACMSHLHMAAKYLYKRSNGT